MRWLPGKRSNRSYGVALARRALVAANDDPAVLGNAAFVLAHFGEDFDAAIDLLDRALELNASFARGWTISGGW